jgi:hypothetical protein
MPKMKKMGVHATIIFLGVPWRQVYGLEHLDVTLCILFVHKLGLGFT